VSAKVNARVCRTLFPQVRTIGLSVAALLASTALAGAQTLDLGKVGGVGGSSAGDTAVGTAATPGTAPAVAPAQGNLFAIEPQSIVSDKFIQDNLPANSDYISALKVNPSFSYTQPNGPGNSEAKSIQMRGFPDGQFNETWDGIPFGDTNDFTHHTTAYFPADMLNQVVVDRGPGYASTVGYATFGGTMALNSLALSPERGGLATSGIGSDNSYNFQVVGQSGTIKETNGTQFLLAGDNRFTNGALQEGDSRDASFLFKVRQPLGQNFVMTAASSVTTGRYNDISQVTLAQAQQYGKTFAGLVNDPKNEMNVGNNNTRKTTDMDYIDLAGDVGYFQLDNKAYTYGYVNQELDGGSQNGSVAEGTNKGDLKQNKYRDFGDILTLSRDVNADWASGTARTGVWVEHQNNTRYQMYYNFITGAPYAGSAPSTSPYKFEIKSYVDNVQPYVEYEWKPTAALTITPGFKWIDFSRTQDAPVNQTTRLPLYSTTSYEAPLAFLSANYRILPPLSVYGQVSQGYLAPNVNEIYVANPSQNNVSPQQTTNYQAGVVWKNDRVTADFDGYYIQYTNLPQQEGVSPNTYYVDLGQAHYEGLEAEGTVVLGWGVSLYGAGDVESAKTNANNLWISGTPQWLLSDGLLYDDGAFFGSLLTKYVGPQYASTTTAESGTAGQLPGTKANQIKTYNSTDLVVGYLLKSGFYDTKAIKLQLGVYNIFDHRNVTDETATMAAGDKTLNAASTTYYWQPSRSIYGSVSVAF